MSSQLSVMNLIAPVFRRSGIHDVELRFVTHTLKSDVLLKRLTTEKTIEVARPDAQYRNMMALHKNVTRKLKAKYYGTPDKPANTFAKCKNPKEIYHLKRRTEIDISNTMHRYGFVFDAQMKVMLKGEDFPDIPMFRKFVYDRKIEGKTSFVSFRLLESFIGVNEWYRKGVEIEALGKRRIKPVYGVWSPTSQDYVNLFARYLDSNTLSGSALDIGSGTGVLSFLLASKGLSVTAIDSSKVAVECTRINAVSLGFDNVQVMLGDVTQSLDLKPFKVIVTNPPWLPGASGDSLTMSIYDEKEQMLRSSIKLAESRLEPDGRFLLIYSDLARKFGLQPENHIETLCKEAGLRVEQKLEEKFPKQADPVDPLKPFKDVAQIELYDIRRR